MDEYFLKKASFFVFLIGFTGLIFLFLLQKPFFIALGDEIPINTQFTLNVTIEDVYSYPGGSLLIFSSKEINSGFFQGNASFLKPGVLVTLEGLKKDDYFSIDKISSTDFS